MEMNIGIISGYFTILHKGHIQYMEEARKLCDLLIVIVNNDKQQINKKGILIHPSKDIQYIIKQFRCVDDVVESIDKSKSVCDTIQMIHDGMSPNTKIFFGNGGDKLSENVPEYKLCNKLGIEMISNIGGGKINSSSDIIERLENG